MKGSRKSPQHRSGGAAAAAGGGTTAVGSRGRILRRLGIALIVIALAWSSPYLASRWRDEASTYKHVALAVDLEEWANLAHAHGGDYRYALRLAREAGINQLSLKEPAVGRLEREGWVELYDPASGAAPPADMPFEVKPGNVYLRAIDPGVFAKLALLLPARLSPDAVEVRSPYLRLQTAAATARELRGGFLAADLALAGELGYELFLRPSNARGVDPAAVLPDAPPGTVVLFQGQEVLGAPDMIDAAAAALAGRGLVLGLLEDPLQLSLVDQTGRDDLYEAFYELVGNPRSVRVHAFTEAELKKLHPEDLVDRSLRGVRDRGIGVLYLKTVLPIPEHHTWSAIAGKSFEYYRGLTRDLAAQGYVIGPVEASGVEDWRWAPVAGMLGAAGGLWILLGVVLDLVQLRRRLGALLVLAPLALGPALVAARVLGGWTLMREAAALAVALAIPTAAVALAGSLLADGARVPVWWRGMRALTAATLLGIAGGLLVAASMAGPHYTLEFGYFRGVKIAHLVPPAISLVLGVLAVWRREEGRPLPFRSIGEYALSFARLPLTWAAVVLLGAGGVAMLIVLGRSGHTSGFQVSALEVAIRDIFDVRLLARPRFKEILMGHPLLLLMGWVGIRPGGNWAWLFPLGLAGAAIGQVSVVNSFSHIRTPLLVSLIRSLNGYWVAIALTAAGLFALWAAARVLRWLTEDA